MGRDFSRLASQRYLAWRELLDFSTRLALAGMRAQGLSAPEAWKVWCRRWAKAAEEHQRANRKVALQLRARDRAFHPSSR